MHTLNLNNPRKGIDIKCIFRHLISIMLICGNYMFECSVNRILKNKNNDKGRIPSHLLAYLLALIIKELKISVEHGRVVTTPHTIKC